ncbi:HAMP domain-containing sensor histidine kinase [Aminobacter anthyllidis]|uniref:sensor histidine kinase n=1 Tax=Aminobacter anthyllidis TaxID=1035067 RepID=UPI0024561B45|nr:HAMP domain-containing sensor histidine kinase [Aminobacter anthyllidis]MDH4983968.1 HAMP domain-containing sensor histidine kinase [Aminobacter anthyllidis]
MSNDLARKLGSVDPRERLQAARYLAEHANAKQTGVIESALAVETVAWVTSALKRALQRAQPTKSAARTLDRVELSADQTAQIYSDALETTAKQIIHEIEPILGALRLSAETEMTNFEGSDTKRGLERMEALVAGLARLRQAASAPKLEEFALDQCIFAWIAEEVGQKPVSVLRAGPQETVVEGDKGLVYLTFVNGLRNAIDATLALPVEDERYPEITVNWGSTDIDVWVAIVDVGVGFRGSLSRAFEIGSTTKAGHLGMGLATAQQAMTSLGGSVRLIPGGRGVRFEMRWPKATA